MESISIIGIDLGKRTFHLHAQDRQGRPVLRKRFSRMQMLEFLANLQRTTIVMEACAGAHYLARRIMSYGHQVKLISPQFVKPFVKTNKNDFIDAEAICEAACRPTMRFVCAKTEEQQTLSAFHRVRESLVRDRVKTSNQIHAFLLEFGVSLPIGSGVIKRLPSVLAEHHLPARLITLLETLQAQYKYLEQQINEIEAELLRQVKEDDLGRRLMTVPGVGPITASLLSAELGDGRQYACGRDFAASLGLVPKQYSTGGKVTLLGISKRGDKALRRLLVQCARSYMAWLHRKTGPIAEWVRSMLMRRHSNVVACALANKLARIVWAVSARHQEFRVQEIAERS